MEDKKFRPVCHHVLMADSAGEKAELQIVAAPAIEKRIFVVRERQVMLDEDLADLYGVETRVLVQQVKRNAKRFPADFMFQLTKAEAEASARPASAPFSTCSRRSPPTRRCCSG
jgi:hypothetical protein